MSDEPAYVFLSYARDDRDSANALAQVLRRRGIPIRFDQDLKRGDRWDEQLREWLEGAAAVVVMWSAHSSNLRSVRTEVISAGDRLVPVVLDGFENIPVDFRDTMAADLTGWDGDALDTRIDDLVGTLRERLDAYQGPSSDTSFTDPSPDESSGASVIDLSDGAREILGFAVELHRQQTAHRQVRPIEVLLGALAKAQVAGSRGSAEALYVSLPEPPPPAFRLADAMATLGVQPPTEPIGPVDRVPDGALDIVQAAARCRERTTGSGPTRSRHLVAAAVTGNLDTSVLERLGCSRSDLSWALRDYLRRRWPAESPKAWDEFLGVAAGPREADAGAEQSTSGEGDDAATEVSADLAGGISADLVRPEKGIPLTDDRLGVGTYVAMLATVIADRNTPMPLSIGLFGEWGSGKSYFMGLLRQAVDDLAGRAGERTPYHRDIVQIGFNAWHYSDANLWASLGDEIFEQLAGPREDDPDLRREALREDLATLMQRRKELEAATVEAQATTARLRSELDKAAGERDARGRELVVAALASGTLKGRLKKAFARLGVGNDELAQGRLLVDELRSTHQETVAWRRILANRKWWPFVALAAAALLAITGAALAADELRDWLLRGGLAGLATVMASIIVVMARARSGVALLRQIAEEIRAGTTTSSPKATKAVEALRQSEAKELVLHAQLDEVVARVGELGRELAELSPGQRLYQFLSDRATSGDYQRQLGLVSTVRKDFEQLVDLMERWREASTDDRGARRPIDRIVLYIDDLDRCSPEQVVDVLQAVHLLLALELFVVVVGVDPRWLLRSLKRQYRGILTGSGGEEQTWWQSTPQNYLEKIFNIPFVLPPMGKDGYSNLMRSIAAERPRGRNARQDNGAGEPTSSSADARQPSPEPRQATADLADEDVPAGDAATIERDAGSEADAALTGQPTPDPTPLTDPEVTHLEALWPLVRTPRAGKRLFNLYRMLRSTRDLSSASQFLQVDHRAVAQLLGILAAYPSLLGPIIEALEQRGDDGSWTAFVTDLEPKQFEGRVRNGVLDSVPEIDVASWSSLVEGLGPACTLAPADRLAAYRLWAPRIARFSFILSSFASDSVSAEPDRDDRDSASIPDSDGGQARVVDELVER